MFYLMMHSTHFNYGVGHVVKEGMKCFSYQCTYGLQHMAKDR